MRAKFYAFDEKGEQIINLSPSDFELTENGEVRTITSISCPPPSPPKALSSVLVVDISGSMGRGNLDKVKPALKSWVNSMPFDVSECAITSFDDKNYLNQEFTNDKIKLFNSIDKLEANGGTDYNEALINLNAGGLQISKRGKYQRVIVLITDGISDKIDPNKIINEAKNQNCKIYCITIGMPTPNSLINIVKNTGGMWYEIESKDKDVENVYNSIFRETQGKYNECEIEWLSEIKCMKEVIKTELKIFKTNTYTNFNYDLPFSKIPSLTFNPPYLVKFENPPIGNAVNQQVTITANIAAFEIDKIISSNPSFTITPSKFVLQPDESLNLNVSFTAQDSSFSFCNFNFINDICEQYYYSTGGYKGKKPKTPTLNLVEPNGGEVFVVGIDTLITWDGVAPTDTISIEYSTNKGVSWNLITNEANGLKYNWKNIPKIVSDQCLVKISQGEFDKNYSTSNPVPSIIWQRTYGGSGGDVAESIIETKEGMLVVVGSTNSKDFDITENKGGIDFWITMLSPTDGSIIWQKTLGGSDDERANSVIETKDGSLIVAGSTRSKDGDITEDIYVVKLNKFDGSIIWQKTLGGSLYESCGSIIEMSDSSIVIIGTTNSIDKDVTKSDYSLDFWIVRLDPNDGSILWNKTIGGDSYNYGATSDWAESIIEASDGSFVIAGRTNSNSGLVTENKGKFDVWVIKLNSTDGSIIWQKTYGGSLDDYCESIIETKDGMFVFAGYTLSNDGDISKNNGGLDLWIVKINSTDGSIVWEKAYGGDSTELAYSLTEASNGNLLITGYAYSINGDITENKGDADSWLLKIDQNDGTIIWQRSIGGNNTDLLYSIYNINEGEYVLSGLTRSNDVDIIENKGDFDFWIVKLAEPIVLQSDISDNVISIVEPEATAIDIDMGQLLVNDIKDSVVSEFISNIGTYPFTVDSIYFSGADANAFSLVSGIPEYKVVPSTSHFGEFRFSPNKVGLHNADIVIITQSDTLTKSIIGVGIEQNIAVHENFIDFGQVNLGDFKDTLQTLTIKNIGTVPFIITETKHSYPNDIDFTTISGGGNFTLQPNETKAMVLRFTPSDVGRTSGMLEFHYNGVGSPAVIQLFGEGIENDSNKEISKETKLIKNISPNPVDNNMMIILDLIEKGNTELSLYDLKGKKVKEFLNEDINETGEKILIVYVDELAPGKYFVVLKTPSETENWSLIIY
jgi:uncharacterized protein YegL